MKYQPPWNLNALRNFGAILRHLLLSLDRQSARLLQVRTPKNPRNFYEKAGKLCGWPGSTLSETGRSKRLGYKRWKGRAKAFCPSIFTKLCASISNAGLALLYEKVVKLIKNPTILLGLVPCSQEIRRAFIYTIALCISNGFKYRRFQLWQSHVGSLKIFFKNFQVPKY